MSIHPVWITAIAEPVDLPEFSLSPKRRFRTVIGFGFDVFIGPRPEQAEGPAPQGPMAHFPKPVRSLNTPGKADPIWDTAFSSRLSRPDKLRTEMESREFVQPKGKQLVWEKFLERAGAVTPEQEWEWIDATCEDDIATTMDIFIANGIAGTALDTVDPEASSGDISDGDVVDGIVYSPSPQHIAAMKRRIAWERSVTCNGQPKMGYTTKCRFGVEKGVLVINYEGPEKNAARILDAKREFKYRWIDQFGNMPDASEVILIPQAMFDAHNLPVQARGVEPGSAWSYDDDDDIYRARHHADPDPQPRWGDYKNDIPQTHEVADCDVKGRMMCGRHQFEQDRADWQARETKRNLAANRPDGYAGPSGLLGLDEDPIDSL